MGYDERFAALEIARLRKELSAAFEKIASLERQLAEMGSSLADAQRANARQAAPFRPEEKKKVHSREGIW